jgi:phthalate 4,5-cis-dihydrodiol dehydrogenase
MTADLKLRLAFIGLGQAVNLILKRKTELEGLPFVIAAACDVREHALAQFAQEFGAETYTSVEALCASPAVDVVYVATGPSNHCKHALIAIRHGKHVIVEKPMAATLDECRQMVEAADAAGVKLLAGHTHSFDAPIRKMREVIESGRIGDLVHINTWNYNAFNNRPWPANELQETHGPVLNQGPHQVDILRQLAGRSLRSLRGTTYWDPSRNCEGGYTCYLEFDDGVPATMVYDGRGYFDTAELFWWVHEGGGERNPQTNFTMHARFRELQALGSSEMERVLQERKEFGRYGSRPTGADGGGFWGYPEKPEIGHQPFFGLTVVSCERGAMRQSADGLLIYDENGIEEIPLAQELRGRAAELMDVYDAVVRGKALFHDGRWGMATLEACLAILISAKEKREIILGKWGYS